MVRLRKADLMHYLFGKVEGHTCGECKNLVEHTYDKTYRKCTVYGQSCAESTDWAKKWSACGMFNKDYDKKPIIKTGPLVVHVPFDEQMKLEVQE